MGLFRKAMENRADRQEIEIAKQEAEEEIRRRKEQAREEVERRKASERKRS